LVRAASSDGTEDMGWLDLARGGLDVRTVPGDHFSLVKEPYVAGVADVLRARIGEQQQASGAGAS
jgi:thioesterase domain-containing protein